LGKENSGKILGHKERERQNEIWDLLLFRTEGGFGRKKFKEVNSPFGIFLPREQRTLGGWKIFREPKPKFGGIWQNNSWGLTLL